MTEKTITYQDTTIFYRTVGGQGKTVVLIHGFAEDGTIWNNQVAFLKDRFKLIIPDIPGSGSSVLLPGATIETFAEIIRAIIDVEIQGLDEVTLIGHSMGGYITLAFAEKYPQYLDSFGLFHSTAFADSDEKKQVRAKAIGFIREKGVSQFVKTSTPNLFSKPFAEKHPEKVNELIETGSRFKADALIQYYEAMIVRPDRTAVLKNFPRPILFIIGEQDNAIPLQSSLEQCYLPAQSHVHLLQESGHMGMWEETLKANQVLLKFFELVQNNSGFSS